MIDSNGLAQKIFSLLKGNGLKIKIYDQNGAETVDPTEGRRFFATNPNIMVTIDEDGNSIEFSKGSNATDKTVSRLQTIIKNLANEFLMNCSIKVFGKSIQPRDYAYQAKSKQGVAVKESAPISSHIIASVFKELDYFAGVTAAALSQNIPNADLNQVQRALNRLESEGKVSSQPGRDGQKVYSKKMEEAINEAMSRMFGSMRTSQQTLENVRILVKHKKPVDESVRGSRTRNISAIFLECNGERFRFPSTYLPGARAMAQHMAHGGTMSDTVGTYITECTSNLLKLRSFDRYATSNKLINENSQDIVETVRENIQSIKSELHKLTGKKTYESARIRVEETQRTQLDEADTNDLKDMFTIRRFDEKLEEVLPIVKQLVQEKNNYLNRIEALAECVVKLRKEPMSSVKMMEFASEHARLGFMLNEFALRIVEGTELVEFVNKVSNKLVKGGTVNAFEHSVIQRMLENSVIEEHSTEEKIIKEEADLEAYFDKYVYRLL